MALKEKVAEALRNSIHPELIHLEEYDSIYEYVISGSFRGMSAIDRQTLIDRILRDRSAGLTRPELRQILIISASTPVEHEVRGPERRGPNP